MPSAALTDRADAIVIGGGHNGLVCAAYLVRAGLDVLVIEARAEPGGCASTVDAVGARVNICNCDHLAFRTTPIADELDLSRFGLRYLDVDPTQLSTTWSGARPWYHFHDVDRTLESLRLTHPDEVENYRRYIAAARPAAELVLELATQVPTLPNVTRRVLQRRARGARTLLAWSRRSVGSVLSDFFRSDALLAPVVVTGPAVWGLSPETPRTGLGALGYAFKHVGRVGRPVGGSGSLPTALAAAVTAGSGRIRCGTAVARILVDGPRVRGVALTDGTELSAPRVIVACDPSTALLEWLTEPPAAIEPLLHKWRGRVAKDGYESKIDAVINELPPLPQHTAARGDELGVDRPWLPTTIVAPSLSGIAAAHRALLQGTVAEQPLFFVNVPSALDATMRVGGPTAGHVLSLEVLFTPYDYPWDDRREPQRWVDLLAQHLGGTESLQVRDWRVVTPPLYESQFHLRRGHAPSFAGGPVAALVGRDKELTRYETPIDGLFLTGAATFPGAGVWGASGRNAAAVIVAAPSPRRRLVNRGRQLAPRPPIRPATVSGSPS